MRQSKSIFIPGPIGQLEAIISEPSENNASIAAIICHPNPTQEGTMHNKVVTTMARAFDLLGCRTVRFNYRGVGRSDGEYGDVKGEIDDLKSVIDWVQKEWPNSTVWLSGFSFGSFVSASAANQTDVATQLVSVAPAVNWHDFTTLTNIRCPWLVIASDADEVVPFEEVRDWLDHPPSPMKVEIMHGASHFFHGRLIELRDILVDRLNDVV